MWRRTKTAVAAPKTVAGEPKTVADEPETVDPEKKFVAEGTFFYSGLSLDA